MAVAGKPGDERRQRLGERRDAFGDEHLRDPVECRRGVRGRGEVRAREEDVNLAADGAGGRDGRRRGGSEGAVLVLGDDEDGHGQITFASVRSFWTRVATSGTSTPACRFAGSSTLKVTSRGAMSTPRSAGVMVASGFFFAFMMFGSEA